MKKKSPIEKRTFSTRIYILFLIALGLVVYLPSLFNGFIADDYSQIVDNPLVQSLKNIPLFFQGSTYYNGQASLLTGLYYRPLMLIVYSFIFHFVHSDPFYFHFIQIILHIATSIMVFFLFRMLFKTALIAFFGSMLFLIHPINSEAVLYIANVQDIIFTLFGLLALLVAEKSKQKIIAAFSIFVFLLFSMLAKESGVIFLIILPIYTFVSQQKNLKRFLIISVSVFGVYLIFRYAVAHIHGLQESLAPIAKVSLETRIINIPSIIFYYVKTFFLPVPLVATQFWVVHSITEFAFYIPLLFLALFLITLVKLVGWMKAKNFPYYEAFLFFTSLFFLNLSLHLQIIPLDVTVADRWFYASSIGIIGMVLCIYFLLKNRLNSTYALIIVGIVIALFSNQTFNRTFDWKDTLTLYTHDLKKSPNNFFLENGIGSELILQKKYKEARPYIEKSIDHYPYLANLNNMAVISLSENNIPKTKEYLLKALKEGDTYILNQNYSNFLLRYDNLQNAKQFTEFAIKKYPKRGRLWTNLAIANYGLGDKAQALKQVEFGNTLEPNEYSQKILNAMQKNLPISNS